MTALTWSPQLFEAVKSMKQQDSTVEWNVSSLQLAVQEKASLACVAAKNQVLAWTDWA